MALAALQDSKQSCATAVHLTNRKRGPVTSDMSLLSQHQQTATYTDLALQAGLQPSCQEKRQPTVAGSPDVDTRHMDALALGQTGHLKNFSRLLSRSSRSHNVRMFDMGRVRHICVFFACMAGMPCDFAAVGKASRYLLA